MKIFVLMLLFMFGTCLDPVQHSVSRNETPHHFVLDYKSKRIKLWVNRFGYVTKATFPGSFDPCEEPNFPHQRNFLIRIVEEEDFRFVAYIDENEELLGVRSTFEESARNIHPTDRYWHLFYDGQRFWLIVDPFTLLEQGIHLLPRNSPHHGLRPRLADVAGIEFYVFRDHDRQIVAASLPWRRM